MTNEEEKKLTAIHTLNIVHDVLSDHGTNLTQTEVNNLLHGITATLSKITK